MAHQGYTFFQKRVNSVLNKSSDLIQPVSATVFGGRADGELPAMMRMVFGISKSAEPDQRNWDRIEKWGKELIEKI